MTYLISYYDISLPVLHDGLSFPGSAGDSSVLFRGEADFSGTSSSAVGQEAIPEISNLTRDSF